MLVLGDESDITQGLWFYEYNGQPLEDKYGLQIETEHVAKFMGHKLDEEQLSPAKGPKPGVTNGSLRNGENYLLYIYNLITKKKINTQ
jgi:hypothetical protein